MSSELCFFKQEYKSKFGLSDYTLNALEKMVREFDFFNKDVLELGGWNIPSAITLGDLGARSWTCVDIIDGDLLGGYQKKRFPYLSKIKVLDMSKSKEHFDEDKPGHYVFNGDATKLPYSFHQRFDAVISLAALEHVLDVPSFLFAVVNSLKKGGIFFTQFGPLWNCYNGHHAWVSPDIHFNNNHHIGNWGHLLLTPVELFDKLIKSGFSSKISAEAIFQIYTSPRINRYFAEDFLHFFSRAGFSAVTCHSSWKCPPPTDVQERLTYLFPKYNDFETCSLFFRCNK